MSFRQHTINLAKKQKKWDISSPAKLAAASIMVDCLDRRGIKREFELVDDDVMEDILKSWENIIDELNKGSWQPIEAAPKNGGLVDLWLEYYDGACRKTNCFYNPDFKAWFYNHPEYGPIGAETENIKATHWMPLSYPPKKDGE